MINRPPMIRVIRMIVIRMVTVITMTTIGIGRSRIRSWINYDYCATVVVDINILAVVNVYIDIRFAVVNVHVIAADVGFISGRYIGFIAG